MAGTSSHMHQAVEVKSLMKDEIDRSAVLAFKPPEISFPYPFKINAFWLEERVSSAEWYRNWLLRMGVDKVVTPEMFRGLLTMDIPKICAYGHPRTSLGKWGFEWTMKYCGMLFVIDDLVDDIDSELGKDVVETLSIAFDIHLVMIWSFPDEPSILDDLLQLLDLLPLKKDREQKKEFIDNILVEAKNNPGTAYPGRIRPECNPFADLWKDAIEKSSPNTMILLAHYTQHWLVGVLQEAEHRKQGKMPKSVQELIQIHKRTAASIPFLLVAEVTNALDSPRDWITSPEMERVLDAVNDLVAWTNDIFSFTKETIVHKDLFNIVMGISTYNRVTYQEAGEILTTMMKERIGDLEAALTALEKVTPPELRENFLAYVDGCGSYVTGLHKWHSESPRYKAS